MNVKVGETYGSWTVIEIMPGSRPNCRTRCSCGNEQSNHSYNLTAGKSTRCYDCSKKNRKPRTIKQNPIQAITTLHNKAEYSAKSRGIDFNLSVEFVGILVKRDCWYCGAKPYRVLHTTRHWDTPYTYNGIDRYDNSIGYQMDNVLTACWECNRMKGDMEFHAFLNHLKQIVKKFSGKVD